MRTMLNLLLLLLLLPCSITFGQGSLSPEIESAAKTLAFNSGDTAKRSDAFAVLEKANKANPNDPYVASLFATALSLQAKYADEISARVFWGKKSEVLIDSVIAKHPSYLFAFATRGVNNSLAPAYLNLSEKAKQDFEFVISRGSQVQSEQDTEALIMSYFYYSKLIQREVSSNRWSDSDAAKAKALLTKLKTKFPAAYDRFTVK